MMDIFIGNISSNQVASDKKKKHTQDYNAGEKRAAFCSPILISKVCTWMALVAFPICVVLMGFWWTLHGVLMGF